MSSVFSIKVLLENEFSIQHYSTVGERVQYSALKYCWRMSSVFSIKVLLENEFSIQH